MAPHGTRFEVEEESKAESEPYHSGHHLLERIGHEVFRNDCLDRRLKRHHITGIAFSCAVGIGLFETSGQILAMGGPVGAILAFLFAGLVIFCVMRSLAEMVSVRPVSGAIMDYPASFVDEALGFTVGIFYWEVADIAMVSLTIAATMFSQYWGPGFSVKAATFVLLAAILFMNACGVRLYGNMEWGFKWLKILLILLVCVVMIAIKAGAGPDAVHGKFQIGPGYSSTAFFQNGTEISTLPTIQSDVPLPGTGGRILAVWTCLTMAMYQFMGGEMVLVTAAEAESPQRDLPPAARYMYRLPGDRLDGMTTALRSPFVIVIQDAGVRVLPGFLNAGFLFSAITAANSALYVSSRTLFFLARESSVERIKNTIGRTNNGHTPLTAIFVSFIPGALAFLVVGADKVSFQEPIAVIAHLYTSTMLCIYASECIAFLRFMKGMKLFPNTINRDNGPYRDKHYRATWQPLWAYLGLVLCVLLVISSGWGAVYDLCAKTKGVTKEDSLVDLTASYLLPALFISVYLGYKVIYKTSIKPYTSFEDKWFPRDVLIDAQDGQSTRNRTRRGGKLGTILNILSWIG
ncbi:hypothetical protein JMJ35_009070 [Cladonia borealis]|uniref:Amino acid permease/ SLC12A domain-containing protein n=1 Tax=Cladonia borealis TaxID=184061 RepID=A0AA39QUX2_9LECA|nr:hypothetical protein JMJ35_009070 [Cladonia borealis]